MNSQELRSTIYDLVVSIDPLDKIEKDQLDFVCNWIASGSALFRIIKPAIPNIHLVSYFILYDHDKQKVLLVDHKMSKLWLPPGGHVEINEHPSDTVKREVQEELGVEADFLFNEPIFLSITPTVGKVAGGHTDISLWYVLKGTVETNYDFDKKEFKKIAWFDFEDVPYDLSDPNMRRFLQKLNSKFSTQKSYDKTAEEYAKKVADMHPEPDANRFLKMLPEHAKIIDIGCGPGRDAKVFSEKGYHVVGIDFSLNMIQIAEKCAPKAKFHVMKIESLNFPQETFFGAWAHASLLHVSKKKMPLILGKIFSILKKEGVFFISVKQGEGEINEKDVRYGGIEKFWAYFQENEIVELLENTGFKILDTALINQMDNYQTHPFIHVFCKKQ